MLLSKASRRLLASSFDEDEVGTATAGGPMLLLVDHCGSGLPFPVEPESWLLKGAADDDAGQHDAIMDDGDGSSSAACCWLAPADDDQLPPSLSFLFPIILMAGFLTSKKHSFLILIKTHTL